MQKKKFYKCDCPIFRVTYSGVFNPYSDVLNPYSGVFLQKKICLFLPHLGRPIVAFLIPTVTFKNPIAAISCKIFLLVPIPGSRSPIVPFLSPIVTF